MTEYVVVGDGAAGTTAAQYIRRRDPEGRITIYADDPNAAYYRAALTNYLIGELREDQLFAVPPDFYAKHRVYRVFARVAGVDTANRRITLASGGQPVPFDRLCIASGSTPNPPPFDGAELQGVMTMRTMQDARAFMEDLRSGRVKRAVVVGGGPLALEWAQALRARGVELTYVLRGQEFMSGVLDRTGSDLVASRLRAFGCDLRVDEEVAEVLGDRLGHVRGVRLKNSGQEIPAQLVCTAIGIRTNTAFLQGSGIEVNRGIPVDERLRTNVDGVYAAGDVAEVMDPLTGGRRGLGLWEPARLQGRVAGTNMGGGDAAYRVGTMYNATRLYDLDFAGIGRTIERDGDRVVMDLPRGQGTIAYRKLVIEDGLLVGAILLGHRSEKVRRHGLRLRTIVEDRLDVSEVAEQMLDPAFDLPAWIAAQRGEHQATRGLAMAGAVPSYSRLMRSPDLASPLSRTVARPAEDAMAAPALLPQAPSDVVPPEAAPIAVLEAPPPHVAGSGPVAALSVEGGQTVELTERTTIGRRPEMDLVLADPLVSGAHAEVRLEGTGYVVVDTRSRNGTFLNERRVDVVTPLEDGDQIRLGGTRIRFAQAAAPRTPAPAPSIPPEQTAPMPPSPVGPAVSGLFVRPEALAEPVSVVALEPTGALEGAGRRFEILGAQASIGRDPQADVALEDPAVSFTHAQLTRHAGGLYLRDLGSRNGTWVNGRLVSVPHRLVDGDVVHVGETDLVYRAAPTASASPAPPARVAAPPTPPEAPAATSVAGVRIRFETGKLVGLSFGLAPPEVSIGRDPESDIAVPEPTVSWRHARLVARGGRWALVDAGSTNGTAVNGSPLEAGQEHVLDPGDEVRFGEVTLRFQEDAR